MGPNHLEISERFASSNSISLTPTKLVEDAHESISLAGQLVAIDAEENIFEVEALLAKWT